MDIKQEWNDIPLKELEKNGFNKNIFIKGVNVTY